MKHPEVTKSDYDDLYYLNSDLVCVGVDPEDNSDPGWLMPKIGAVPRNRETAEPLDGN